MSDRKTFTLGILWILVLLSDNILAEFSIKSLNSEKGASLVEKAKRKAALSNSCWQNAYRNLFEGCSEILAREEQRSRLAWRLSDCFQKETAMPGFPYCDDKSLMVNCLQKLDEDTHRVYLEFYLETNAICHQLQTEAFKKQTERLVKELKRSAEYAEDKLENIHEKAESVLHSSNNIHDSLSSIDVQTQQLAETSKYVEERVNIVLERSHSVYQQSNKIAAAQTELQKGQMRMSERIDEGMMMVNESANKLGEEMNSLRNKAVEIEEEIGKVGNKMFMRMNVLQSKADDIESVTETSLNRQKQLLESQSSALEVIQTVTRFQSQALEESRGSLQQLISLGNSQQRELIRRQELLKQAHDHLIENSKSILAAQETFESKQASMFRAIDKLLTLHNALLLESQVIKAFLVYSISIFILFMFTSTKQTYSIRPRLYIGLCVTFFIELVVLRYGTGIEQQAWIISFVRLTFSVLASCQLSYAIYTYKDYETLNHLMLQSLIEKVNEMQVNKRFLSEDDDDVDWSTWIDSDLLEDEPDEFDSGSFVSKDYNFCRRHQ